MTDKNAEKPRREQDNGESEVTDLSAKRMDEKDAEQVKGGRADLYPKK